MSPCLKKRRHGAWRARAHVSSSLPRQLRNRQDVDIHVEWRDPRELPTRHVPSSNGGWGDPPSKRPVSTSDFTALPGPTRHVGRNSGALSPSNVANLFALFNATTAAAFGGPHVLGIMVVSRVSYVHGHDCMSGVQVANEEDGVPLKWSPVGPVYWGSSPTQNNPLWQICKFFCDFLLFYSIVIEDNIFVIL